MHNARSGIKTCHATKSSRKILSSIHQGLSSCEPETMSKDGPRLRKELSSGEKRGTPRFEELELDLSARPDPELPEEGCVVLG